MTLPEIIYDIKRTISGGDTTVDSKFIDAHLTQVVNQARAEALSVHYMQMREKRSLSEANQDFIVLQNSSAFRQNITDGTTDADDLESDAGGADMPGGSAGSVLYRKLKKYSIEASEGTVYEWDKTTENRATTKVTDVCRFTLPSPVLKFGRNSGFLSFTDHSYDAIKGTQDDANYYYPAPQLGGDHVRVVHGLKELRDLQKHKASFPYKSGHRDLLTGDTGIFQYRPTMSPSLYADTAPATAGSGNYTQWITLKNPIACITNSDLFLNGIPISHENSSESNYNNAVEDEGWSNNEYFELESQYNHQYRRKDVVMLIDTPIGKINPDNVKLDINKSFGVYLVSGIFADPTKLPNYNFKRSEYPIPQELLPQLKQNLIANQLMIARQIEEDLLNDGNDKSTQAQNVQPRRQAAGRPNTKA